MDIRGIQACHQAKVLAHLTEQLPEHRQLLLLPVECSGQFPLGRMGALVDLANTLAEGPEDSLEGAAHIEEDEDTCLGMGILDKHLLHPVGPYDLPGDRQLHHQVGLLKGWEVYIPRRVLEFLA
jgi:hypothetical protein